VTLAALIAASVGGLTLVEYAFGTGLGIDQLLFHDHNAARSVATGYPGRMGVATALALVLSSCALGLLARGRAVGQHVAAAVVLLIPLSAALGYLYGADSTGPWGTTEVSTYTWQC
jgi:hypothetical protein